MVVTHRHVVGRLSARALHGDVVTLRGTPFAEHDVDHVPVSEVATDAVFVERKVFAEHHLAIARLPPVVAVAPFLRIRQHLLEVHAEEFALIARAVVGLDQGAELRRHVGIVRQDGGRFPGDVVRVIHRGAIRFAGRFRGDEDHTEGRTRTVDGGRCGVLEHGDALDVLRVEEREVVHRHPVDEDEGGALCAVAQCSHAADGHRGCGAKLTAAVHDREARHGALKRLRDVRIRPCLECLTDVYRGHGAGQVDLLLRAVTHDDDFVQQLAILMQHDAHRGRSRHLLGAVADVGDDEPRARFGTEREFPVGVGDCTVRRAFFQHAGADNGLALIVHDHAVHDAVGLHFGGCRPEGRPVRFHDMGHAPRQRNHCPGCNDSLIMSSSFSCVCHNMQCIK